MLTLTLIKFWLSSNKTLGLVNLKLRVGLVESEPDRNSKSYNLTICQVLSSYNIEFEGEEAKSFFVYLFHLLIYQSTSHHYLIHITFFFIFSPFLKLLLLQRSTACRSYVSNSFKELWESVLFSFSLFFFSRRKIHAYIQWRVDPLTKN